MKKMTSLLMYLFIAGSFLANAQESSFISNLNVDFIVTTSNPVIWEVNDTDNASGLVDEYVRLRLTANWCGENVCVGIPTPDDEEDDPDQGAWSSKARIVIRSNAFDDIDITGPKDGGNSNDRNTKILFEADFPSRYIPNTDGFLEIEFFQDEFDEEYLAQWKFVEIELVKPAACERPIEVTTIDLTSNRYEFSWSGPDNEVEYQWQIVPWEKRSPYDGCILDSGITSLTSASTDVLITDTPYVLQIKTICESGEESIVQETFFATAGGVPPLNDNIEDATEITGDCKYIGTTEDATIDSQNSPLLVDYIGNPSVDASLSRNVWYKYAGDGSGTPKKVKLNFCGSSKYDDRPEDLYGENTTFPAYFNTYIYVYTGSPNNLTLVDYNDDAEGNCSDGDLSKLTFDYDGNSTYWISVGGTDDDQYGIFELDVKIDDFNNYKEAPENDNCENAQLLDTNNTNFIQGTLEGATASLKFGFDTPCFDDFEFQDERWRDVWYKVNIDSPSNLTVNTAPVVGNNAQFSLYSSNFGACGDWSNLLRFDDIPNFESSLCSNGAITATFEALDGGTYFIRVFTSKNTKAIGIKASLESTLTSTNIEDDYSFSFQPNPVSTTLNLNANQNINKAVLYTIQGQRVLSINPNTMHSEIDMSGLANGLYFIEVAINNTIQTARIIKQ